MDKLATRLPNLPLILAGPILRRVTETSVTVWVALKNAADVSLQIRQGDPGGSTLGEAATEPTIDVGRFMHICAVTAPVTLTQGVVYTYDMSFAVLDDHGAATGDVKLLDAIKPTAIGSPISYPPYDLPSFSLPPKSQDDLRIIHGSCRMPHGTGPDALSILDEMIRITVADPTKRPHQLFMTGDQIYADDVSAALLLQLMDASNTLLGTDPAARGWKGEETLPAGLPVGGSDYHTHKPSDLPPLTRTDILDTDAAGFTSADLRSHLMSLGEFLCMYLFTWSDVLWPAPANLPTLNDLIAAVKASHRDATLDDLMKVSGDTKDVQIFMKTLFRVRRALANIPTYMIFDDHDVTDDWNMSPEFCEKVYHPDNGLGRRIVQNALVAYALCQLWGNTPEQFGKDGSGAPAAGRKILDLLNGKGSSDYDGASKDLQPLVGVHDFLQMKAHAAGKNSAGDPLAMGNYHDQTKWLTVDGQQVSADSLTYNFVYTGPAHQVVVTDTRSWRAYPNGSDATADLLPLDQMIAQIPLTPDLGDRVLMVVVTTNAPPVQPIRGATRHDTITTFLSKHISHDAHPDLFEAWEIPSLSFDHLLKRITDKFKPDKDGVLWGQALLLSGDVHHSFASRLLYVADNRFGDTSAKPPKARAVIAQLVSSSFKKQNDDTVGFQKDGYTYVPHWPAHAFVKDDISEGYVGWNVTSPFVPGVRTMQFAANILAPTLQVKLSIPIRQIRKSDPTIQIFPRDYLFMPIGSTQIAIELTAKKPDYRYRLDYLFPSGQARQPSAPKPIPPPPASGDTPQRRQAAMDTFNVATGNYRAHLAGPGQEKLIGRNNISEITFQWGGRSNTGDFKRVNHTIRWRTLSSKPGEDAPDPDLPATFVVWTNYDIDLNPFEQPTLYHSYSADIEAP